MIEQVDHVVSKWFNRRQNLGLRTHDEGTLSGCEGSEVRSTLARGARPARAIQLPGPRSSSCKRFRGGLAIKAHRHFHHSTLGLRVIQKKKRTRQGGNLARLRFSRSGGSPSRPPADLQCTLAQRLIDSCITQLKAQGPSRSCNESKEEAQRWGERQTRTRRERRGRHTPCPRAR